MFTLAQDRKVAQGDGTLLGLVVLVGAEVFEEVIDTARRHRSDAKSPRLRVESGEDLRRTLEVGVGVGEVQQLEAWERSEDSAIPAEEALETTGGETSLVEEAEADGPLFIYK